MKNILCMQNRRGLANPRQDCGCHAWHSQDWYHKRPRWEGVQGFSAALGLGRLAPWSRYSWTSNEDEENNGYPPISLCLDQTLCEFLDHCKPRPMLPPQPRDLQHDQGTVRQLQSEHGKWKWLLQQRTWSRHQSRTPERGLVFLKTRALVVWLWLSSQRLGWLGVPSRCVDLGQRPTFC